MTTKNSNEVYPKELMDEEFNTKNSSEDLSQEKANALAEVNASYDSATGIIDGLNLTAEEKESAYSELGEWLNFATYGIASATHKEEIIGNKNEAILLINKALTSAKLRGENNNSKNEIKDLGLNSDKKAEFVNQLTDSLYDALFNIDDAPSAGSVQIEFESGVDSFKLIVDKAKAVEKLNEKYTDAITSINELNWVDNGKQSYLVALAQALPTAISKVEETVGSASLQTELNDGLNSLQVIVDRASADVQLNAEYFKSLGIVRQLNLPVDKRNRVLVDLRNALTSALDKVEAATAENVNKELNFGIKELQRIVNSVRPVASSGGGISSSNSGSSNDANKPNKPTVGDEEIEPEKEPVISQEAGKWALQYVNKPVLIYNEKGKVIDSDAVVGNGAWAYANGKVIINGEAFYRITAHQLVKASDIAQNVDAHGIVMADGQTAIYDGNGNATGSSVRGGSSWIITGKKTLADGQVMYQIATGQYLKSNDAVAVVSSMTSNVDYVQQTARIKTAAAPLYSLNYDDNTLSVHAGWTLSANTEWKVNAILRVADQTYYLVAKNTWLKASDSQLF